MKANDNNTEALKRAGLNSASIEPLSDLKQASKILGIRERTLRSWIARGQFPAVRLGRRTIRVRVADLEKFIATRSTGPSAGSASKGSA